jgi:hypothetical protein
MQWNDKLQLVELRKKSQLKNQMITLQPGLGVHRLALGQVRSPHTWHHVKSWSKGIRVLHKNGQREQLFLDLRTGVDTA